MVNPKDLFPGGPFEWVGWFNTNDEKTEPEKFEMVVEDYPFKPQKNTYPKTRFPSPYHPWENCIFTYMKTIQINKTYGKYAIFHGMVWVPFPGSPF